jgi:hypothetical protein
MNKCSPVEMSKNLEAVEVLRKAGIDFVPMPVTDNQPKELLLDQVQKNLDEIFDGTT